MKHNNESKLRQTYNEAKVVVNDELEEKLKTIKVSPIKIEKALQATKNLDLERIKVMQSVR